MQFSVIYSVDVPEGERLTQYLPTKRKQWDTTEGDEQYDYSYLEGRWEKGKHRKLCAVLNQEDFDQFLRRTSLYPESCETMGSLGAPGFGFGWAPAISFNSDNTDAILNAYVTPLPCNKKGEPIRKNGAKERDWDRIKAAILSRYR